MSKPGAQGCTFLWIASVYPSHLASLRYWKVQIPNNGQFARSSLPQDSQERSSENDRAGDLGNMIGSLDQRRI